MSDTTQDVREDDRLIPDERRHFYRGTPFTIMRLTRQRMAHIYKDRNQYYRLVSMCQKHTLSLFPSRACAFFVSDKVCPRCLKIFREQNATPEATP